MICVQEKKNLAIHIIAQLTEYGHRGPVQALVPLAAETEQELNDVIASVLFMADSLVLTKAPLREKWNADCETVTRIANLLHGVDGQNVRKSAESAELKREKGTEPIAQR